MTGSPFTIFDSNIDADRNGELVDPVPAGTYSGTAPDSLKDVDYKGGRNGANGPDYFQVDVRAGWRRPLGGSRVIEVFLDIYNIIESEVWPGLQGLAPLALVHQVTRPRGGNRRIATLPINEAVQVALWDLAAKPRGHADTHAAWGTP